MKIFLKIVTLMWAACWLCAGIFMFLETPKKTAADQKFIATQIKPSVDFIKNFKATNGRLPNNREYYSWQREYYNDYSSDLTQQTDSLIPGLGTKHYILNLSNVTKNDYDKFKNADWSKDFAISAWRGEWTEYYFSWTDSYDTNNYSWTNGYIQLTLMIGIGVFPLLFWRLNSRRQKSST